MPLLIHVNGDILMINEITGFNELTGKNTPPKNPKITIGILIILRNISKFLQTRPKNNPIDTTTIDSHIKKKRTAKNFPPKLIRKIHFNTTKVTKLHIESTAVQEKVLK